MTPSLPANVHVSTHPSLRAKLSQLRSRSSDSRDTQALVTDISSILACQAFSTNLNAVTGPNDVTHLGFEYATTVVNPDKICIIPILRSGLAMVSAVQLMLPAPVPVHHLGMYREPLTLEPVEYYNNLPNHVASPETPSPFSGLAIIVDPIIATGGTCAAAIQTLREWGAKKVLVLSVLGAVEGIHRAAAEWPEATEFWVAGVDEKLTPEGMLQPGLGDIGDRLFLTIGK